MRRLLSLAIPLFAFNSLSQAVVWADDITNTTVVNFGNDARFRGVGRVTSGGTGTFIGVGNGSGWMITANHVMGVGSNYNFVVPSIGTFNVVGTYRYDDVMVARITNSITSSAFTSLASGFIPTLNTLPITSTTGLNVVSAGFGYNRSQSGANYGADNTRRGFQSKSLATVQLNEAQGNSVAGTGAGYYVQDRFDRPGDANKRAIEGFGAPGDSGSMYMNEANNQILGVLSGGAFERYGAMNYYSAIRPEITTQIYASTGINPVPEPATMAALGLGLAALARRRRRA